jgi:hypothetical protein
VTAGAPRAAWATLVGAVLGVGGCNGTAFELRPTPRATAAGAPVTAQVRRVDSWRDGDLGAPVVVVVDLHNSDPARPYTTLAPRLVARSLWGGPAFELELKEIDGSGPEESADRRTYWTAGATGPSSKLARPVVPPGATRTLRLEFGPGGEAPSGPYRLILLEQVDGDAPFEVPLADPPSGPRWQASRAPIGVYLRTGWGYIGGSQGITFMEPIGLSARFSFGRLVLGLDERYTFLFRTTRVDAGNAFGASGLVSLAWQPWSWYVSPYVDAGGFVGVGQSPRSAQESGLVSAPRASAGILWFLGSRIGAQTLVPIDRPLSPQRGFGFRVAYTHWFHTGEGRGSDGVEMSFELGFSR